jgi:hypothetical protein
MRRCWKMMSVFAATRMGLAVGQDLFAVIIRDEVGT